MKKLFMLVALMFGLASCQNEPEDLNVVVGGEQDVMINVSLPDETRTGSADGFNLASLKNDNNYQFRYILEIYLDGGTDDQKYRDVKYSDETSISFPVRLAPGRAYSIAVWADVVEQVGNAPGLYYNAESLKNISINESNWTAMDEKRDAFYGKASLGTNDPVAGMSTITLKRPFAKVRVISTDIGVVRNFGLDPTDVSVEYLSPLYTSFNAVSGEVCGTTTSNKVVTANYATAKYDDFVTAEATLFADYIFVPAGDTIQFAMTVNADAGEINTASFTTPIPVEVNKVTTIKGDVLTEGGNVSVKIENELGEKETINLVDTAESLQEIINNTQAGESANIALGGDIDLGDLFGAGISSTRAAEPTYGLLIKADRELTLDLNGFTISQSKTQTTAYSMIENRGTLTIKDSSANKTGKLSYADNGQGGNYVSNTIQNSGVLTIYGGTIENNSSATVASNGYPHPIDNSGTLVINDGTFTNNANYSSMRIWCTTDDNTIVTIKGGTFNGSIDFQTVNAAANKGTLTITGGTFIADTYTKCAVRLLGFGTDVDEMNGYIRGGQFNGAIALKNWSGSELNSKVFDITGGTFTVDPSEFVNDDYTVKANDGNYTVARKPTIAKIGDDEYTSLIKAIAAVQDGDTITLVANEVFTENNRSNNSGYWDGVAYSGDKSFTIDLGGNTVSQDGALNDYLFWIKNDGSKANTITIKNGTLDAGTSAYCALCTSTTSTAKITINLEDINLVGNNSKGAVAKIRGGAELNVKAGTIITGKNNDVGIEAAGNNTVVNIYDNAKIYQNGTNSDVGAIVGASQNATMNIYGGYGKSAKCGIIVMSTGATINVSGGEWIANNDGTFANDNKAVLVSQNNRYESSWACKSILNVTGGTFKGGYNCYGMGPGVEPDDAQINIKGGNFNANPASYVAKGYGATENNGIWAVAKAYEITEVGATIYSAAGMFWFANEVNVNGNSFSGKTVTLANDIDLKNAAWTPIGQTGATQFMGTFDGNNKVISNLNIDTTAQTGANYSLGLFGWLNAAKVKNVTIDGAIVKGNHNVGVIAGYLETAGCTIEGCSVTNATIEGHHANDDACGDKVGGIVGHAGNAGVVVKDCTISNSTISAGRDAGQIAGAAKEANVIGCSATNVAVTANDECTGANVRNEVIGRLL